MSKTLKLEIEFSQDLTDERLEEIADDFKQWLREVYPEMKYHRYTMTWDKPIEMVAQWVCYHCQNKVDAGQVHICEVRHT